MKAPHMEVLGQAIQFIVLFADNPENRVSTQPV